MKKILAGLLALCLLSGLCACGGGRDSAPLPPATENSPSIDNMTGEDRISEVVEQFYNGAYTIEDIQNMYRSGELPANVLWDSLGVDPPPDLEDQFKAEYWEHQMIYMGVTEENILDLYQHGEVSEAVLSRLGIEVPEKAGGPIDITAGPILMEGSLQQGFTAAQMDLSTGELKTVFTFYNDKQYQFPFGTDGYLGCYFAQQLFDEKMTKLAVSWYNQTDSSQHVGWVDGDGNLTDVTEILHPHTTDFSSKIPHDNYALFSPDGYFVFTDLDKECYCFVDIDTMSVVDEVPYMIDDSSYYSEKFGNTAYRVVFMPNGSLKALWHTEDLNYAGANIIDFGDCCIELPDGGSSSHLTTWDCFGDEIILCTGHDSEGHFIAEIGKGIGEQKLEKYGKMKGNYVWNLHESNGDVVTIKITPHSDYRLERCAYSNGQIAFIGSRGSERFLFTVEEAENSNPTQIAPLESSWQLLFWK
ncbi:hypothetical protein D1641_05655 [Colidextribacter sp. OB.20]|uniref:hypothetical protein n=1 Tax=Colidextribacter sp. OB.20 TaxID=2304568 RepID=UPI001371B77A|nr:hypothetical protein [Colidextribacter sp. OB.20]NBI09507.1 hypothetical protein [Colidextribacter sp. OB.20]